MYIRLIDSTLLENEYLFRLNDQQKVYSGNFLQHTDIILFFAVLYFYCFYYFCICICNVINTLTVSVRKFVGSVIVFVLVLYNI